MRRRTWLLSAAGTVGALVVGWSILPAHSRMASPELMLPKEGSCCAQWLDQDCGGRQHRGGDAAQRDGAGRVHRAADAGRGRAGCATLGSVRIEQAGFNKIYGNVVMFLASLPFHPSELEAEHKATKVKVGQWMAGKIARELGINATGGWSSVADLWEMLRMAAASARASLLGAASLQWKLPLAELSVKDRVVSHPSGKSARYGELAKFAAATPPGAVKLKDRRDWTLIGQPAKRLDVPAKVNGSAQFGLDVRPPGMLYAAIRLCPMLGGSPGAINSDAALSLLGVERLVPLPGTARRGFWTARWKYGGRRRRRKWAEPSQRRWRGCRWTMFTLHVTLLGGGFGRRLEVDYIVQAVRVAAARCSWRGRARKTHHT